MLTLFFSIIAVALVSSQFLSRDSPDAGFRCADVASLTPPLADLRLTGKSTHWAEQGTAVRWRNASLAALLPASPDALSRYLSDWSQLEHPSLPRLAGWCVRAAASGPSVVLREDLISWHDFHARKVPWCARLHAALSAVSLLSYLEDEWAPGPKARGRGVLFCDMQTHHWAVRSATFDVVLVAPDNTLQFADRLPLFMRPCAPRTVCLDDAPDGCWSRFEAAHKLPLSEFMCQPSGSCLGFDPSLNLFALAKMVLVPLLSEELLLADDAPVELVDELHTSLLRRALALHKRDRLTATQLLDALRKISLDRPATACAHEHRLTRDPRFYDAGKQPSLAELRRRPLPLERWPAMTTGVSPGRRPTGGFRNSDDSDDSALIRDAFASTWQRDHAAAAGGHADQHSRLKLLEPETDDEQQIKNTASQLRQHDDPAYFRGLMIAEQIAAARKHGGGHQR